MFTKKLIALSTCVLISFSLFAQTSYELTKEDLLVKKLMDSSGLAKSLGEIPDGLVQTAVSLKAPGGDPGEFKKLITEFFEENHFTNAVFNLLRTGYDEKRYSRLIDIYSKPVMAKMVEAESRQAGEDEFSAFMTKFGEEPISKERMALVRKISKADDPAQYKQIQSVVIRMYSAMHSQCIEKFSDKEILHRSKIIINRLNEITKDSLITLSAYTLKDFSDKELAEISKNMSNSDMKWFDSFVMGAINRETDIFASKVSAKMSVESNDKKFSCKK